MLAFSGQYMMENIRSCRLENGNKRGSFCFCGIGEAKGGFLRFGVICRCCRPLTANAGYWTNLVQRRIGGDPTLPMLDQGISSGNLSGLNGWHIFRPVQCVAFVDHHHLSSPRCIRIRICAGRYILMAG